MQQFTGQSTLCTVINPLSTPIQPWRRHVAALQLWTLNQWPQTSNKASPPCVSSAKHFFTLSFPKTTPRPYLKRKYLRQIYTQASHTTCSCLPRERGREPAEHATDVSPAAVLRVLPEHGNAGSARAQKMPGEGIRSLQVMQPLKGMAWGCTVYEGLWCSSSFQWGTWLHGVLPDLLPWLCEPDGDMDTGPLHLRDQKAQPASPPQPATPWNHLHSWKRRSSTNIQSL